MGCRGHDSEPEKLAGIAELVSFEPKENLFAIHDSVNKARRFVNCFQKWIGAVDSHIFETSKEFPIAIFLLQWDVIISSDFGKSVIRAGQVVQQISGENWHAQGLDWALPDIFAPFRTEWYSDLEFGSLWNEWVKDVGAAAELVAKPAEQREAEQSVDRWE